MKCLKNLFVATTRIEIFSGTKLSSNYEETKHYKTLIGHKTSYFLLSRAYNLSHLAFLVVLRKATQFFFTLACQSHNGAVDLQFPTSC